MFTMQFEYSVLVLSIHLMIVFPLKEGKRAIFNIASLCDASMDSVRWTCVMFKSSISQILMLCISPTYAFAIGLGNERKLDI